MSYKQQKRKKEQGPISWPLHVQSVHAFMANKSYDQWALKSSAGSATYYWEKLLNGLQPDKGPCLSENTVMISLAWIKVTHDENQFFFYCIFSPNNAAVKTLNDRDPPATLIPNF